MVNILRESPISISAGSTPATGATMMIELVVSRISTAICPISVSWSASWCISTSISWVAWLPVSVWLECVSWLDFLAVLSVSVTPYTLNIFIKKDTHILWDIFVFATFYRDLWKTTNFIVIKIYSSLTSTSGSSFRKNFSASNFLFLRNPKYWSALYHFFEITRS